MPNKSDYAGKLHEYFTYLAIKTKLKIPGSSPFDDKFESALALFDENEKIGLEGIGLKTADLIIGILNKDYPEYKPCYIHHVGESSGAGKQDITDDLVIKFENEKTVGFSLKSAKSNGAILSRNMGAESLLSSYFEESKKQAEFNVYFNKIYLFFLNSVFNTKFTNKKEAKKYIKESAEKDGYSKARFEYYTVAKPHRNKLLNSLRDALYDILLKLELRKIIKAANLILDSGKHVIFGNYKTGNIKYCCFDWQMEKDFKEIGKRGNDSVVIIFKDFEIGFRYKFESGITSSIKLVGDYKQERI
jgi:hypothetical protein